MDRQITEAIVLAGGLGTRLRSEIGEHPKALAPVNGQPFLHYLLNYLKSQGIKTVILSVGYKHEMIEKAIGNTYNGLSIIYAVESEPRGTGGGLKLALEKTTTDDILVCNGDTFFDIDLSRLTKMHQENKSNCTIALKKMENGGRYGNVVMDDENKIIAFHEKSPRENALINGGMYCIKRGILTHYPVNTPFSFETNYLENGTKAKKIFGLTFDNYFKDIGVPEDYKQFELDQK